jgi:4,5:9,10-diseco-3-hydroxy-5,9,17-trioxoandrosta-1(10),2-diene-4-oate hydrolase
MRSPIPVCRFHRLASGVQLHYTEAGRAVAGRATLLFIHGGGPGASGYSNYKHNIPAISAAGYHVIAPDLPGFGLSDKPADIDYTSTLNVEALHELVCALGLGPLVLVGNSWGGGIALEYTLQYPGSVRALVLVAPAGVVDPATYWLETEGGRAFRRYTDEGPGDAAGFQEFMFLFVHAASTIDDAIVSERYPIALLQPRRVFTSARLTPVWERLQDIECPILCFWGTDDCFLPPAQALVLLEQALDVKVVLSNGAGHWYMLELPDDFNREVIAFLAAQA